LVQIQVGAPIFAPVAQWIEQRTSNSRVVGSIPTGCANIFMNINITATNCSNIRNSLLYPYWHSDRILICSAAVSLFLNKTPPKITVSLTEEKPKSKAVKVGIIDCEKVEILESDLACYEKNEHVAVFTKLTELIANNFPTETCWISIHEN
jgi:hypothetical protein